ncbi:MAG: alpha-glucosidase [Clostridia bacterium]|nr:alpha-glucosidase [Clostridia bacterium]
MYDSIKKYRFGKPIQTNAVTYEIALSTGEPDYIQISENKKTIEYKMGRNDKIYGLGEAVRGINKRGWIYESYCNDDPLHTETKRSLYGAHPFIIVDGENVFGLFTDYPDKVVFDIGYTDIDTISVTVGSPDYDLYIIFGDTPYDIVKAFRKLIGKSYTAPFWSFGFQQSRWSYYTSKDVQSVIDGYRDNDFPIDAVYLDIDYMESFKDFTVSEERFPEFDSFVKEAVQQNIHLVPIIDAGVKIEDGYTIYDEGKEKGYFCKDDKGKDFVAAVWPGKVCFPDFLNDSAAAWFGSKYKYLIDKGIDGFWNDMNEPAIFYSENRLEKALCKISSYKGKNIGIYDFFGLKDTVLGLSNSGEDYSAMYHNINGESVCHDRVHNLYGYKMTTSASNAFKEIAPDKNILLFSRASYIGMHRYSGIWMGDNQSWWSHIKLNLQMLPSLNMCGFLYSGADLTGFGDNCTEELALRWLALGIFTPLMRNHSALGTRDQEYYRFKNTEVFRNILKLRYALIPYIYSEFMKAVENDDMLFKPLAFVYRGDKLAEAVEDQLIFGDNMMIAPVYEPNALGRYVYIPEDMCAVRFRSETDFTFTDYTKGHYFVEIPCDEVVVFIRKNTLIPLISSAPSTAQLDYSTMKFIGKITAPYVYTVIKEKGILNGISHTEKTNYRIIPDNDTCVYNNYTIE